MTPTVSVVIATRNYGQHLPGSLTSALGQTFDDIEVIVIDDGSTDGSEAIARPFLADQRMSYHRIEGRGQPTAKNLGVALATGEFIAFLDADDAWEPTKLERQVTCLRQRPEVGLVYTGRSLLGPDESLRPEEPPRERGRAIDAMLSANFICFSSVMVRRQLFERFGRFDQGIDLAIDFDMWLRALPWIEIDVIDEPLVRYRVGHQNLSSRVLDRVVTVEQILTRAIDRRDLGQAASPAALRAARATLDQEAAILSRFSSLRRAAHYALRSLLTSPRHPRAWHTLAFVLLTPVFALARRLTGRAEAAWSAHYRRPINDWNNA